AVAARVLGQVLLVVLLGEVVLRSGRDLGRDGAVDLGPEALLGILARLLRGPPFLISVRVDRRPVLRADVVALAHALRGVVALPEDAEQVLVADLRGVEHDAHDFRVPRAPRADLAVRRVGRRASSVADGRAHHPGNGPESLLGPPEAAHPEDRL